MKQGAQRAAAPAATLLPILDLVLNMAVGFEPVGMQLDTGVWRLDPPENPAECFDKLRDDDPDWNDRLFSSIKHEGTKPENQVIAWAAWQRTQEEVNVGWCSPVVGGRAELETRFGARNIRLMRRFGVLQAEGKCRCCDSGTASGHNPCTAHPERLVNVRADFPLETAAEFAMSLELDGTWTMHVSTNDVVAAFRRVACAGPSTTIVCNPNRVRRATFPRVVTSALRVFRTRRGQKGCFCTTRYYS